MDLDSILEDEKLLPRNLFILPLAMKPLFPGLFTPLMVTDQEDIAIIEKAQAHGNLFGALLQRSSANGKSRTEIGNDERFYRIGTLCRILKTIKLPDGGVNVFVATQERFQVEHFYGSQNYITAQVSYIKETQEDDEKLSPWLKSLKEEMKLVAGKNPFFTEENRLNMVNIESPGRFADYMASILDIEPDNLQRILETIDIKKRIEEVLFYYAKERKNAEIQADIQNAVNKRLEKSQRDYFLREELKNIQKQLGMGGQEDIREKLRKQIDALGLEGEALETVNNEYARFASMDQNSPEYTIALGYLQTVVELPWKSEVYRDIDLKRARKVLEADHYGMKDVKDRILEFLAIRKKKEDTKGAIICLVGPPGVGKTSVGISIARALGKKYYRFSVGGLKDESEIKGHRRTYIGAMPGKLIQGLKIVKTKSPVFLIDEIDKMGESFQGDPSSALLEALDPEQNTTFRDRYLDLPFDLSQILFIVTANTLDTIPSPLLDRMEIIELSGYTSQEKLNIGKKYLVPKSLEKTGLQKGDVKYSSKVLMKIAEEYCREAGVRNFEKALDKINRKIALETFTLEDMSIPVTVNDALVAKYLGLPPFPSGEFIKADKVGTAIGLAWTSMGGATLFIEAEDFPGNGELKITGQLGDVMKESVSIAWTYLQREAERRGIDRNWFKNHSVHLHLPEGAVPKDGPSAGITLTCALYSLVTKQIIKQKLAMTGELTLTGKVMPIGGLKEKVLAAKRDGIDTILYPAKNQRDLDKLSDEVKAGVTFFPVEDMQQVLSYAFPNDRTSRMSEEEYEAKLASEADEEKKKQEAKDRELEELFKALREKL